MNDDTYRDLAFMRFDGECWECDPSCHAELNVTTTDAFESLDAWMKHNQDGFDATVTFKADKNRITVITENAGISIRNTVTLTGIDRTIYTAVTGDQTAITNIRILG